MTERADVVVVGGGIIGCGIAAELASRGVSVVLVERSQIGAGASGRNHGLIFRPEEPGRTMNETVVRRVVRERQGRTIHRCLTRRSGRS